MAENLGKKENKAERTGKTLQKKKETKKEGKKPDARAKKPAEMKEIMYKKQSFLTSQRSSTSLQKYEGQPYETIKFVLMTEKAIRFIESQNRLMFVVDRKADRQEIRKAVEAAFKTKTSGVNVLIDQKGRKRAFVKFEKPGEASEIAIRLGII